MPVSLNPADVTSSRWWSAALLAPFFGALCAALLITGSPNLWLSINRGAAITGYLIFLIGGLPMLLWLRRSLRTVSLLQCTGIGAFLAAAPFVTLFSLLLLVSALEPRPFSKTQGFLVLAGIAALSGAIAGAAFFILARFGASPKATTSSSANHR
jgi:hypothetical protein